MNAKQVQQILVKNFRGQSHNEIREYLGMSSIGRCPREQYFNVVDPSPKGDRLTWYGMIGYSLEERVIEMFTPFDAPALARFLVERHPDQVDELIAEIVRWIERKEKL